MAYIPRLSEYSPSDMHTSPLYNEWNAFEQIGHGLPNCTAYCWARAWEIYGPTSENDNRPRFSMYDAGTWWGYTQDGYERGQVVKLGATACWRDVYGGAGHVATVEEIDYDRGIYTISNSAFQLYYFRTYTIDIATNYFSDQYEFQGFIYNPYAEGGGEYEMEYGAVARRKRKNLGRSLHYIRSK